MAAAGLPFCGINLTPNGYTWPLNGDSRDWANGGFGQVVQQRRARQATMRL